MATATEARPTEPLDGWMIVLAKPHQQKDACEALERRGIERDKIYFPMTKKKVFNQATGRFEKIPDYYFSRYFFVEYTPDWIKDVLHAKGVAEVLHREVLVPASEEVPSTVIDKAAYLRMKIRNEIFERVPYIVSDDELYRKVRSREVYGYIPPPKPPKHGLQRGQRVKVVSGAMIGRKGTLAEDDDGRNKIAALFDIMGSKEVKVVLEKGNVIAV